MSVGDTKTFPGITDAVFACVKAKSAAERGTVYDPPEGDSGTATTAKWGVVLTYSLVNGNLTYVIKDQRFFETDGEIFGGIQDVINSCSGGAAQA